MAGADSPVTTIRQKYRRQTRRPLLVAGVVLGLGLGGFLDGIVLHQMLQWHHMVTSAGFPPDSVENLQLNTLWDGVFHAGTWVLTVTGLVLLWRALERPDVVRSTRTLIGCLAAGWGGFNLIEGAVDHLLLGVHHVNETVSRGQWIWWDMGFLGLGFGLAVSGWALIYVGRTESDPENTAA